jgi:hypothetical protein
MDAVQWSGLERRGKKERIDGLDGTSGDRDTFGHLVDELGLFKLVLGFQLDQR